MGFVENEALIGTQWFYSAPDLFGVVRELWDIVGPYALLQKHTSEIRQEDIDLTKEILRFYVGGLDDLNYNHIENFTKMMTDSFFWFGVHRFLAFHVEHSSANTYFY